MTEDQNALARRLVAHPKWKWVPGMSTAGTVRVDVPVMLDQGSLPNLTDYATAAILLRMAMEAHREKRSDFWFEEILSLGDLGTVAAQALLEAWGA